MKNPRSFWIGFAAGAGSLLVVLALAALAAVFHGRRQLDARIAERMAARGTPIQPLLAPPPLPALGELGAAEFGRVGLDWSLRDLDGQEVAMERFRGEVLLLGFWATWCAPCVAEMPGFVRLERMLAGSGARLLLVTDEPAEVVRVFAREKGLDLPFYLAGEGVPSAIFPPGRPTAFVVDCEGRIVLRHVGGADWGAEPVREFLAALAARC